jgi:hypothetical protein
MEERSIWWEGQDKNSLQQQVIEILDMTQQVVLI